MTRKLLPAELPAENVIVIIDTREQNPLDLSPLRSEPGTLATGDYSVKGLEHVIAIERKELGDYLSCVGRERERFEREMMRMLAYPTRAVVVEATWGQLEMGGWRSSITPQAAIGSAIGWIAAGIPIVMVGDRVRAQVFVGRLLYTAARRRWREARSLVEAVSKGIDQA